MKADMATAKSSRQDDRAIATKDLLGGARIRFLENVVKSHSSMAGSTELARETRAFSQKRVQAYVDAWLEISKCKDLRTLSECQEELAKKAISQYMEAASAIVKRYTSPRASRR